MSVFISSNPDLFYGVTVESGATRTLAESDNNTVIVCTAAGGCTITVDDVLSTGFSCVIIQRGAVAVTISAAGGMTLRGPASATVPLVTAELDATIGIIVTDGTATASVAQVFGNLG